MSKFILNRCLLLTTVIGLCAPNVPAQDPAMVPPPVPAVIPAEPPDPDTLPPPPTMFEWQPLVPRGGEDDSLPVTTVGAPPPEVEPQDLPPPLPIIEPLLDDVPDPAAAMDVMPEIEVWRDDSVFAQRPPRSANQLAPVLVTGNDMVTVLAQFNPAAVGKVVYVRPGRGTIIGEDDGARVISLTGDFSLSVRLDEAYVRGHIIFYCEGVKTILPIKRSSLQAVQTAEGSGGGE